MFYFYSNITKTILTSCSLSNSLFLFQTSILSVIRRGYYAFQLIRQDAIRNRKQSTRKTIFEEITLLQDDGGVQAKNNDYQNHTKQRKRTRSKTQIQYKKGKTMNKLGSYQFN